MAPRETAADGARGATALAHPDPLAGALQDFGAAIAEFAAAVRALERWRTRREAASSAGQPYVSRLRRLRQEYGRP
jgi:hypothetical protein